MRVAYITEGQLKLVDAPGTPATPVRSEFAEQVRQRSVTAARRNAWKSEGESFAAMSSRGQATSAPLTVAVTGVTPGADPGTVVYTLETGAVSGLFRTAPEGWEQRLMHTERFRMRQLARRPEDGRVVCSLAGEGVANLGLCAADGGGMREITEGDSYDLAPAWVPGAEAVVFQSAGLARSPGRLDLSPFAVMRLDLGTGAMETLAEEPGFDLLSPRIDAAGALWYIRCPHGPPAVPLTRHVVGLLTWPFRLILGLFRFLDLFARLRDAGKPEATGPGHPRLDDERLKALLLHGALADAAWRAEEPGRHEPSSVSGDWELVRRAPGGAPEVVARHVFAFDLAPDGRLVTTDGQRVNVLRPGGPREEWASDRLVRQVVAVP